MRTYRFLFIALIVGLAVLGIAGCSKGSGSSYNMSPAPPPPPAPQPNTVVMSNYAFSPTTVTVAKGTTITWQNNDGVAHTSTSDTGVWDTGNIPSGGSKTTTFDVTGTFPFHCSYHTMMTGKIVVQ